jgi:hypothetical protein
MFIEFTKDIVGTENLGDFVKPKEPRAFKHMTTLTSDWQYRIDYDYNINDFVKLHIQQLEDSLKAHGSDPCRYSDNKLWINGPDQFLLILKAKAFDPGDYADDTWRKMEVVVDSQTVRTMKKPIKLRFRTVDAVIFTHVPQITLIGQINYALTGKIDPIPLIQLLQTQGYKAELMAMPPGMKELLASYSYRY